MTGAVLNYLEHLSSAFTITGSDQWCMDIQKAMLLEEVMCCKCQCIAYPSNSPDCVCPAHTQMQGRGLLMVSLQMKLEAWSLSWVMTFHFLAIVHLAEHKQGCN